MQDNGVVFRRINGRVVPIRKKGAQPAKPKMTKKRAYGAAVASAVAGGLAGVGTVLVAKRLGFVGKSKGLVLSIPAGFKKKLSKLPASRFDDHLKGVKEETQRLSAALDKQGEHLDKALAKAKKLRTDVENFTGQSAKRADVEAREIMNKLFKKKGN